MKTKNKIISILMCLCLAVLPGCSQEGGGETGTKPANTSAAGNNGGSDPANSKDDSANSGNDPADSDSNGAEVTEAENPTTDERFAYYDLLSAEYAKGGKLYGDNTTSVTGTGKLLMVNPNATEVKVYDTEKNAVTAEVNLQNTYTPFVYYLDDENGCFYTLGDNDGSIYSKYDNKGNLIAQTEKLGYNIRLMPDGTLFSAADSHYNMYSSDWKTKTELPVLQIEGEHGIKKDVDTYKYIILGKYGSKVYAYSKENDNTYYCLNTDTMTWGAAISELNNLFFSQYYEFNNFGQVCYNDIIGRYLFVGGVFVDENDKRSKLTKIYDMETDTVIATISVDGFGYDGRNYSLWLSGGALLKTSYPGDGSEAVTETVLDSGDTSLSSNSQIWPVNEKYYRYQDQYGVFLREYGKGEDGEITVWLYNN